MKHGSIKEWYEKADKASVNHDQEWFKQCLQDKTKLCIWEYLRDISIKKLTNANTFSNSQCSQSNGLLMIMNLTTNKTSGWYYDISSNESRFIKHEDRIISPSNRRISGCWKERFNSSYEWNNNTRYLLSKASHKKQEHCALRFTQRLTRSVRYLYTEWVMILRDIS